MPRIDLNQPRFAHKITIPLYAGAVWPIILLQHMSPFLAHRVILRQRGISVALGAKRT
jgi:hypothetical protein